MLQLYLRTIPNCFQNHERKRMDSSFFSSHVPLLEGSFFQLDYSYCQQACSSIVYKFDCAYPLALATATSPNTALLFTTVGRRSTSSSALAFSFAFWLALLVRYERHTWRLRNRRIPHFYTNALSDCSHHEPSFFYHASKNSLFDELMNP